MTGVQKCALPIVVAIRAEVLAEDHPDRLASQHELARAYQANGQVKEAVKLLERVVAIEAEVLAEDHPSRLISERMLAAFHMNLSERSETRQASKRTVLVRRLRGILWKDK